MAQEFSKSICLASGFKEGWILWVLSGYIIPIPIDILNPNDDHFGEEDSHDLVFCIKSQVGPYNFIQPFAVKHEQDWIGFPGLVITFG